MRRLLVLLFAFTVLAAACGDDGGDDASPDDTGSASDADDSEGGEDSDGEDSEGSDSEGGDSDGSDSDTSGSEGDDSDGDEPTGDGIGSDFCDFYDEQQENDDLDPFASPEELEAAFREAYDAVDRARDLAPDEIRADMEEAYEQYGDFIDLMEESGWNFLAVPEDDPRALLLEESEVWERLDAYCDDGSDDGGTAGLPGDDQLDEFEDLIDPENLENFESGDIDAFAVQLFTAMGHDQETAECLVDELGADFDFESAGADVMSQEFCGMTVLEIFAFGG